mmetsp:Transcript_88111/g.233942  ORF Transcript_88111/g.233942 Transcript_88111/m.233942 type:complete len:219 (-) Transcript_88111:134-790(-)
MDLAPRHLEVVVPSGGPAMRAVGPLDIVGEDDFIVQVDVKDGSCGPILAHADQASGLGGVLPNGLGHTVGLHLKADYPVALVVLLVGVVLEEQLHVVVDVEAAVPLNAHWEAVHVREVVPLNVHPGVARGPREVVYDPVHQVLVLDHAPELVLRVLVERELAEDLASDVLHHLDVVGGVLDHVPLQDLAQILHALQDLVRGAERQNVVPVGQLGLRRG